MTQNSKMPVNINLIQGWKIKSYKYGWILMEEDGDREFARGYYTTIIEAIESFLEKKLRQSNATSIQELISYIKSLETALNSALQPLNMSSKTQNIIERRKNGNSRFRKGS